MMSKGRLAVILAGLILIVGIVEVWTGPTNLLRMELLLDFLLGAGGEDAMRAWLVLTELRLPRVVLAGLLGAALAVSGVLLQTYFRNPLAEPYVLGISSGAGLGAVVWSAALGGWTGVTWGSMGAAWLGALLAVLAVMFIAHESGRVVNSTLLLAGVAVGALCAALTTAFLLQAQTDQFRALLGWLMGSVARQGWEEIGMLAPVVVLGTWFAARQSRAMDWLAVDEDAAFTSGVEVRKIKGRLLWTAVVLTASSVAVCGAVAFVGLMVPHALRRISGASHRGLIGLSALGGALLVMVADGICRIAGRGVELPLSVVTSALGAVFFLVLLRLRER
ncbi:MAG: FecCD family ABC transporter permease [Candidatus Methylacidiphilales bacterium]